MEPTPAPTGTTANHHNPRNHCSQWNQLYIISLQQLQEPNNIILTWSNPHHLEQMKKIFMMINPGGKLQKYYIILVNHCSTWNHWNRCNIFLFFIASPGKNHHHYNIIIIGTNAAGLYFFYVSMKNTQNRKIYIVVLINRISTRRNPDGNPSRHNPAGCKNHHREK